MLGTLVLRDTSARDTAASVFVRQDLALAVGSNQLIKAVLPSAGCLAVSSVT